MKQDALTYLFQNEGYVSNNSHKENVPVLSLISEHQCQLSSVFALYFHSWTSKKKKPSMSQKEQQNFHSLNIQRAPSMCFFIAKDSLYHQLWAMT